MIKQSACEQRGCRHYAGIYNPTGDDPSKFDESQERHVCVAFPEGIPAQVNNGEVLHEIPLVGDGGIIFEPGPREYAVDLFGADDWKAYIKERKSE